MGSGIVRAASESLWLNIDIIISLLLPLTNLKNDRVVFFIISLGSFAASPVSSHPSFSMDLSTEAYSENIECFSSPPTLYFDHLSQWIA